MTNERVFAMPFGKVYACLIAKAERKGRTKQEVDTLISWLTGYDQTAIDASEDTPYGDFFRDAPAPNPARTLITGKICGVRIEEIEDPVMREIRYLDKLVDELAKGRTMDKIQRHF